MKKIFLLSILALLSTSFIACNKDNDDDDNNQSNILKGTKWSCDQLDENKTGWRMTYEFIKDYEFTVSHEYVVNGVVEKTDSDNDGEQDDVFAVEYGAYIIEGDTLTQYCCGDILKFTFKTENILRGNRINKNDPEIFYEFIKIK